MLHCLLLVARSQVISSFSSKKQIGFAIIVSSWFDISYYLWAARDVPLTKMCNMLPLVCWMQCSVFFWSNGGKVCDKLSAVQRCYRINGFIVLNSSAWSEIKTNVAKWNHPPSHPFVSSSWASHWRTNTGVSTCLNREQYILKLQN